MSSNGITLERLGIKPLRLTFNQVCTLLSITRDTLRGYVKEADFPQPYKSGTTQQAAVFFDYQEIIDWHSQKKLGTTKQKKLTQKVLNSDQIAKIVKEQTGHTKHDWIDGHLILSGGGR